jgi:CRP-like cAMP-binding protein
MTFEPRGSKFLSERTKTMVEHHLKNKGTLAPLRRDSNRNFPNLFESSKFTSDIRSIIIKPPRSRTDEDIQYLIKAFKEGDFFSTIDILHYIGEVVSILHYESYCSEEIIVNEGDPAEAFYIIIEGAVDILKKRHNSRADISDKISRLIPGQTIGETCLMNNCVRGCSAKCAKDTELIKIYKKDFAKIIERYKEKVSEDINEIMANCGLFKGMSPSIIKKLSEISKVESYNGDSVVIKQGEMPTNLILIKKGNLKVLRKIYQADIQDNSNLMAAFKEHTVHTERGFGKTSGFNKSARRATGQAYAGMKEYVLLEVDTLGQKEYLCDFELVHQVPMVNTFYASMPTELIVISIYQAIEIFSESDIQIMGVNSRKYPNNQKILANFLNNQEWDGFKKYYTNRVRGQKGKHGPIKPEDLMRSGDTTLPSLGPF